MSELAERRAETARRNGALSRGPVTEAGLFNPVASLSQWMLASWSVRPGVVIIVAAVVALVLLYMLSLAREFMGRPWWRRSLSPRSWPAARCRAG